MLGEAPEILIRVPDFFFVRVSQYLGWAPSLLVNSSGPAEKDTKSRQCESWLLAVLAGTAFALPMKMSSH